MLYGGPPLIPLRPPKLCINKNNGYAFKGPQIHTYGIVSMITFLNFKIRYCTIIIVLSIYFS